VTRSIPRLVACLVLVASAPAAAQGASETAVKAAYLVKFGGYVDWPAPQLGPLTLCIVGRDPLGTAIDRAAAGQQVNGRPVQVRRITRLDRGSGCAIAFVSGSPAQDVAAALGEVDGAPVLTVTDSRWSDARGIIHFQILRSRVRFHIDEKTAARCKLGVSSKLLAIALTVRSRMGR
jgi:hypothetical protein